MGGVGIKKLGDLVLLKEVEYRANLISEKANVTKVQTMSRTERIMGTRLGKRNKDKELRLYTWNIRTLYSSGALRQLTNVLTTYKADVTAL